MSSAQDWPRRPNQSDVASSTNRDRRSTQSFVSRASVKACNSSSTATRSSGPRPPEAEFSIPAVLHPQMRNTILHAEAGDRGADAHHGQGRAVLRGGTVRPERARCLRPERRRRPGRGARRRTGGRPPRRCPPGCQALSGPGDRPRRVMRSTGGSLAGRVALVTGAGRGIGAAIARAFAGEGAVVGLAARAFVADLSDESACAALVRRVEDGVGPLDVLVNNAGIATSAKFVDTSTAEWRRVMALDLDAPFFLTRAALPGMLARSRGAVINIASVAARAGFPYVAAYTAAKHGLLGLTRALAAEYPASGVTFNCVCPFYVDTAMTETTVANIMARTGRSRDEVLAPLLTPQGRLVAAEDVAAVCLLLASDAGRSINGQAVNVDGGRHQ